jgi:NAD(P)-dependent dehydrogenase (short-subunit alcohol dehydrogenase family)
MVTNLFNLSGRVAVVTGAASGLGQAMAQGFAQYGADIVGADINDAGLAQTVEQITAVGRQGLAVHCDVTQPEDVRHLFEELDRNFGRVDILVNDAFTAARSKPEELSLEAWDRVMRVNITGYFLCAQEAGRRMINQGWGGSIINISSIGGVLALGRGNFVYSISKGAVNQLTRELAVEWGQHRIRVNAIVPCQFRTPPVQAMFADPRFDADALLKRFLVGIPLGRIGEPGEDIVGPAVFLASDASAMVTGALLPVDGGNLAMNAGGSTTW